MRILFSYPDDVENISYAWANFNLDLCYIPQLDSILNYEYQTYIEFSAVTNRAAIDIYRWENEAYSDGLDICSDYIQDNEVM